MESEDEIDKAIIELFYGKPEEAPESVIPPPDWSRLPLEDVKKLKAKADQLCPLDYYRQKTKDCIGWNPIRFLFPRSYCQQEMTKYSVCSEMKRSYLEARKELITQYVYLRYTAKYDSDNFEAKYEQLRKFIDQSKREANTDRNE